MASPLPPDPYLALGLPRDATAATIKTTYRKLILKFHPDKVQDAAQKKIASDQFHKIQTAYEIIGEEDRRARYDAQCKLAELRKGMMGKQSSAASPTSEVRGASYSRTRAESPARANYTARGAERSERVHVEERRPYDAETEYFDRPRSTARKDYDYERSTPKRAPSKTEKERSRTTKQSTKENERARQKEKTRQSTRDTRRDRDYKHSYPEPETASSSDSDTILDAPRYSRREEEDRRRERDPYYEQPRRREDSARAFHVDDRSHKMQTYESTARDYIERSRGGARQYQEPVRRPSPQRVSTKDKVEYIKRSEGRPPVMVRRGSGKPRPASREPEEELPRRESPIRESPRHERERTRRSSNEYDDMPRQAQPPPLNHTKSAPDQIHLPGEPPMPYPRSPVADPRRAYSMQEPKDEGHFRPAPMRRAETMPPQVNASQLHASAKRERERESTRKPQKASGLRKTENLDSLPTPSITPEPTVPQPQRYPRPYADDNEIATPDGYRTKVHEPVPATGARKVTRSPSPMKTERVKEDRGRTSSSRYPPTRPPMQPSRTTSYVYGAQGLQDVSATRPTLGRNETVRPAAPQQLYGEVPTTSRSSPRQTRTKYSPPEEDSRYARYMSDDRPRTGYNPSRRNSEAVRPSYGRNPSYTSQAAY
jgi:curved DNA-binding protein CbpA